MGLYVIVWKPCISLSPPEALLRSPTLHTPPDGSRSEGLLGGPGVGGLPHLLFPELEDTVVAGCGVSRDENPPTWPPIPRRSTSWGRFPPSRAARPTRETFTQRVSTGRGAGPWLHRGRGGVNEGVPRVAQSPPTDRFSSHHHPHQDPSRTHLSPRTIDAPTPRHQGPGHHPRSAGPSG